MADAFAFVPVVTPEIVAKFIRPSLERLMERLHMPGITMQDTAFFVTAQLHGEARKQFEDFIIWSNDMFFCIAPDLTPEYARQVAADHGVPLMAGISAKQVEFGSIEKTSEDKLLSATRAVRIYGASGADENTPCEVPETVTFREFLKEKIRNNTAGYEFAWLKVSKYSDLA